MSEEANKYQQPINESFFDAAFKGRLADNKEFKPITNERAKELIAECMKHHEEVYLPAEKKLQEKLGRPLTFIEMLYLTLDLKPDDDE